MRQRNIKHLEEKLDACREFRVDDPADKRGMWKEIFGNDNPLFLEIGCGKGKFIADLADQNPEKNFVAIEGQESVVLRAFEKAKARDLQNLRIIVGYVDDVREYFAEAELAGIYLNFSDPWPKERHAKRRLTYHKRLMTYARVIDKTGFIEFKTDNDGLFDFTLEQIEEAGMSVEEMTTDLHNSNFASREITTEYEDKFRGIGKNINYVKIRAI
ncbi:MAG TPA: tRNA (guanosine(46)-N7)-methyltransferase TrmB [Anaerovoracaceae bacterium]|nr:tRNA (guanosine(46)-N7)-methyltransferase TrmB [Anaerovoracaceae bacterium]